MKLLGFIAALAALLPVISAVESTCKEGDRRCISKSTAVICLGNSKEQILFTCASDQYCKQMAFRPWPVCAYKDGQDTVFYPTASPNPALQDRKMPEATDSTKAAAFTKPTASAEATALPEFRILDPTPPSTCKGPRKKWCLRKKGFECQDGQTKMILECKHHCVMNKGEPQCGGYIPGDTSNDPDDIQARNNVADTNSDASINASATNTRPVPTDISHRAELSDAYCGMCNSHRGLNQPLRTSNNTCRNHSELGNSFVTCRNVYCGLCIVFSERDCQGAIMWSGGRGESSSDRKANGGQSYFCY